MDIFPYSSLTRRYTRGTPRWRIVDSGEATMQLGNGILRTRDELGQAIYAIDLLIEGLTEDDSVILWSFILDHRAQTFWWRDIGPGPLATTVEYWECRFDPSSPPRIVPRDDAFARYDATIVLLPMIPTVAVP